MEFDPKKIANTLRELRERTGLTQAKMAEDLKIRPATISDYERARIVPPVAKLFELSSLYGWSINEILGTETEKAPDKMLLDRLVPLVTIGIFGGRFQKIEHEITKDPTIMVHLGINQVPERKNLFTNIVKKLTTRQQHVFTLELLKYLHSLIAVDRRFSTEELAFAEFVQTQLAFFPSAAELSAIRRAGSSEYFGGGVDAAFPSLAIKRFTLWIMNVLAIADGEFHESERTYIQKVASHLSIDQDTAAFIESRSAEAFNGK